ncbi:hypothetical protein [Kitasatospora sp. NPDC101183]|uniref:hypothetical protein n=1 Tax=Kitasatospora sp. NPDC101183 TaxID=3364100 RepID=UPI003813B6B1
MEQDRHPDEHVRFARYRAAFARVAPDGAAALIGRVLADPDAQMANSAVCEYLDRRGAELLTDPGFPAWQAQMAGPVAADSFAGRRLHEWSLIRSVELGEGAGELTEASTWCQLRVAEHSHAPAALAQLADDGRTRRVRHIARDRLRRAG